ncbi:hypothetical protein ACH5RR_017435 [Cinchona calisaya]|uniref:serine O-acetyltransferase n=1 Tax=Cinchona calisaya TaxID=153742 RepID=A0ABD2ZIN0_9GENT
MAACIDSSRNHGAGAFCVDSCESQINTSLCKVIRFCRPSNVKPASCFSHSLQLERVEDHLWLKIREEALLDTDQEPILSEYYQTKILSHHSLESALANHLAEKLGSSSLSSDALFEVFVKALTEEDAHGIKRAILDDLKAWKESDPACLSYVHCFLNFKGFLACQAQRIAHKFWVQGRNVLAVILQSRVSEVFGVDIHPGARIGRGIVIDHATGVVIGETAVVGDNVTIFHSVTLGGTGKVVGGDRHPKIGDGVLVGAGTKVLGNIRVGDGAKIGAGSVVLKEVPSRATVVGNPDKMVRQSWQ